MELGLELGAWWSLDCNAELLLGLGAWSLERGLEFGLELELLFLREFRRPYLVKTWSFGLARLCKAAKVKHDWFELIIGICLNPYSFF